MIDFIEERAIIWKDETLGAEYEILPLESFDHSIRSMRQRLQR